MARLQNAHSEEYSSKFGDRNKPETSYHKTNCKNKPLLMQQNHFHTNINSGHETAPYNKKYQSNPDPRHDLKQDPIMQKEHSNFDQNVSAKIDISQHKKMVNSSQPQAQHVEDKSDETQKK